MPGSTFAVRELVVEGIEGYLTCAHNSHIHQMGREILFFSLVLERIFSFFFRNFDIVGSRLAIVIIIPQGTFASRK